DLLDLHAALRGRHDHHAPRRAVERHPQIQLAGDVQPLLDEQALDFLPLGAGLRRDELHAEDLAHRIARGVLSPGDFDTAALAAAAGVDLRLDHDHGAIEPADGGVGLLDGHRGDARGHGHAVLPQDVFALVFVNFHSLSASTSSFTALAEWSS